MSTPRPTLRPPPPPNNNDKQWLEDENLNYDNRDAKLEEDRELRRERSAAREVGVAQAQLDFTNVR